MQWFQMLQNGTQIFHNYKFNHRRVDLHKEIWIYVNIGSYVNIWMWEDNSEIVPGGLRMYLWEPKSSGFEAMNMLGSPSRPLNLTELDTWYTIQFSVHVNLAKCLSGISTCQQKILFCTDSHFELAKIQMHVFWEALHLQSILFIKRFTHLWLQFVVA